MEALRASCFTTSPNKDRPIVLVLVIFAVLLLSLQDALNRLVESALFKILNTSLRNEDCSGVEILFDLLDKCGTELQESSIWFCASPRVIYIYIYIGRLSLKGVQAWHVA